MTRFGLRGLFATMRGAIAEARANRAAFAFQVGVMIANDLVWIAFWVLFFRKVGSVHGWDARRIRVLFAVLTTAGGITLGFLANARRVGTMAVAGELDAVLALPVMPLAYLLVRRIEPTNIGDVIFGVGLFTFGCAPTPSRTATFLVVVIASATLITSFLVLTGSLAFFAGRSEGGELGFHALLLLGNYPVDVFAGAAKIFVYSVVPAAFVSTVPARLVDHFSAGLAAWLAIVTVVFALAAQRLFSVGLRRYTSGAVWTRA